VPAHRFFDIGVSGIRPALEQSHRAHDLATLAVAALNDILRNPSILNRPANRVLADALDGNDGTIADQGQRNDARSHRYAGYVYRAGAAGSDPATVLGTGHLQVITQNPEQRSTEVDGRLSCLTVHGELVSFHEQTSISGIPRARHAGFDPRPGGSDKFLMSERRQRAERAVTTAARLKCPEHQRFLHVMP